MLNFRVLSAFIKLIRFLAYSKKENRWAVVLPTLKPAGILEACRGLSGSGAPPEWGINPRSLGRDTSGECFCRWLFGERPDPLLWLLPGSSGTHGQREPRPLLQVEGEAGGGLGAPLRWPSQSSPPLKEHRSPPASSTSSSSPGMVEFGPELGLFLLCFYGWSPGEMGMSWTGLFLGTRFQPGKREVLSRNRHEFHRFLEMNFYLKFKTILLHTANCALWYITVS